MGKTEKLLATVEHKGLLTLKEATCLVAGEAITGSWWAHPRGKEIYRVVTELEAHEDIRMCKLLGGRQTFVHRRLWPALVRVAAERKKFKAPSAAARKALQNLNAKLDRKVREELERSLLVIGESEHTPQGHHEVRLKKFADGFPPSVRAAAKRMKLDVALAQLEASGWTPG